MATSLTATAASATTITWNNAAGGAWSNASNWTPNQIPGAGDAAVLPALSGPYQVTLDINPAAGAIQIDAGDPTLDLNGHSIASVGAVDNYGTITNFAGAYDSNKLRNHAGGMVAGAPNSDITVGTSLWSDGTIVIGPGLQSRLVTSVRTVLVGNGKLVLDGSLIYDPTNVSQPSQYTYLEISAGFTVTGSGVIGKYVTNRGLLECDNTHGQDLRIDGLLWNYATVRVANQGRINVNRPLVKNLGGTITSGPGGGTFTVMTVNDVGGSIDFRPGGRLLVDGGDLLVSCGTTVDGEVQRASGTGAVVITIANFQNMKIAAGAEMSIPGHADIMTSNGTLTNNGTLRIAGSMNFGIIAQPDSISIGGTGTVILEGGVLGTGTGATLWNKSGQTIQGCGTISPPFVNDGTVNLDCGLSLGTYPGRWVNRRTMNVRGSRLMVSGAGAVLQNHGRLTVSTVTTRLDQGGMIDNSGGVLIASLQTLDIGSTTTAGSIAGGRLEAEGTGHYRVRKLGTLNNVTLGPTATLLTAAGATTTLGGARFTNQGLNRVVATGRVVVSPATDYVQTEGATALEGGAIAATRDLQVNAGALRGTGIITANVVNGGELSPDAAATPLRIEGNYRQLPGGVFRPLLGGADPTSNGKVEVTGTATLDGTLVPALASGFTPVAGARFDVLTYGALAGQFGQLAGAQIASPTALAPIYGERSLTLIASSTTGVGDHDATPSALRFYASRSPRGTRLVLELPHETQLKARLYDLGGREVARLADGVLPAGVHVFTLDGAGGAAHGLAAGVYFARAVLTSDGVEVVRAARVLVLH